MPEKPSWAYAVALSQPNVLINRPWNFSSASICALAPLNPPSNGMIEKLSGSNPRLFASCSSCLPKNPVPSAVAAVVIDTTSLGLLRCRICAAPSSLCTAVAFSYSGSSRSKSTALSRYLVTTPWYAEAVASGLAQVWPSFVPPNPPMDTLTSPPLDRMRSMTFAASVSSTTDRLPSQVAVQPPAVGARMKASWKARHRGV